MALLKCILRRAPHYPALASFHLKSSFPSVGIPSGNPGGEVRMSRRSSARSVRRSTVQEEEASSKPSRRQTASVR